MDDNGEWYTTKSLNKLFDEVTTEPMHLNVERTEVDKKSMMNKFLISNSNTTTMRHMRPAIILRKDIIRWK